MNDPIETIRLALLGRTRARICGPWVETRDREGWACYDTTGARLARVYTSPSARGRWTLYLLDLPCPRCRDGCAEASRHVDPDTGRQWLTSSAAIDYADRWLAEHGWVRVDVEDTP